MEQQKAQNCQGNPEEKNRASDITFPDFRRYYKVLEIKTAWDWHIADMWISMESPETNPHPYRQVIFDKGGGKNCWACGPDAHIVFINI